MTTKVIYLHDFEALKYKNMNLLSNKRFSRFLKDIIEFKKCDLSFCIFGKCFSFGI